MKRFIIKIFDKVFISFLGLTGILTNSCTAEYGMPYADYEVRGTVTDNETGNIISNIQVVQGVDTVYTNTEGRYEIKISDILRDNYTLKIEDIDGKENGGEFIEKEIEIIFTKADRTKKGDRNWYEGKFEKTLDIEFERKITEE